DVSVPQVCHVYSIYSNKRTVPLQNSRLPHSEIPGSQSTYDSPRHIGVSPVLHRLLVPRHSPYALLHLTSLHLKHFYIKRVKNASKLQVNVVDHFTLIYFSMYKQENLLRALCLDALQISLKGFASLITESNNQYSP